MDYEKLKGEIKEIAEIAASVPEAFREKCFEILLQRALGSGSAPNRQAQDKREDGTGDEKERRSGDGEDVPVPSHVKAFMRRKDITQQQINALVMLDGGDIHFLKEPSHNQARRGQNEWALLVALKTGLLQNSLKSDPEEVRSMVQEKGYYDATNFSSNFRQGKHADYFKATLEPQGPAQGLSAAGEQALADLISQLVG